VITIYEGTASPEDDIIARELLGGPRAEGRVELARKRIVSTALNGDTMMYDAFL